MVIHLCFKIRPHSRGGFRDHDPGDAAVYLDRWLRRNGQNEIRVQEIEQVMERYELRVGTEQGFTDALRRVNAAFEQRFGRKPIHA